VSPGSRRTRRITLTEVRGYMGKAEQFLEATQTEYDAGRYGPATSLAVHAAINAADVVSGLRSAQRSTSANHDQTLGLLREAGRDGRAVATQLQRLLPLKNRAEYDPQPVARTQATAALRAAQQAVGIARQALADRDTT
jgi:hypothetical protein